MGKTIICNVSDGNRGVAGQANFARGELTAQGFQVQRSEQVRNQQFQQLTPALARKYCGAATYLTRRWKSAPAAAFFRGKKKIATGDDSVVA
jgi:hypothetical protein